MSVRVFSSGRGIPRFIQAEVYICGTIVRGYIYVFELADVYLLGSLMRVHWWALSRTRYPECYRMGCARK